MMELTSIFAGRDIIMDAEVYEDGTFEIPCYDCGEPMLLHDEDMVDYLEVDGEVVGLLCAACNKRRLGAGE